MMMMESLGRLALMLALMGAAAVPTTAYTQTPAPPGGFVDTDGDGINDAVESPACVGDRGASRGGFVDSRGCTSSFGACFAARPDSYYTCGAPKVWDDINLKGVVDDVAYVVDSAGRRYNLHPDHMPMGMPDRWAGQRQVGVVRGGHGPPPRLQCVPRGEEAGLDRPPPPDPTFLPPGRDPGGSSGWGRRVGSRRREGGP